MGAALVRPRSSIETGISRCSLRSESWVLRTRRNHAADGQRTARRLHLKRKRRRPREFALHVPPGHRAAETTPQSMLQRGRYPTSLADLRAGSRIGWLAAAAGAAPVPVVVEAVLQSSRASYIAAFGEARACHGILRPPVGRGVFSRTGRVPCLSGFQPRRRAASTRRYLAARASPERDLQVL